MSRRTDPAGDRFFALRTFRRDGSLASTPIWLAPSHGRWYGYTPNRSWKVTRIRRDPRVEVAASDFEGRPLGPWHPGRARTLHRRELHRATQALTTKYGNRFRLFRLLTVLGAFREHGGRAVGLEITLAASQPAGPVHGNQPE
ncbi:MAG: PPOX class F420-dependent oxidoreductase [Microlunatus sp.]|nr:PPOX class F420-dependent oxidoreductase [Microlunatus sp.]